MSWCRKLTRIGCLVMAPWLCCAGVAQAGLLSSFAGFTRSSDTEHTVEATGNYAVFDRLTGASSAGDVFGTGYAGFDSAVIAGPGSPTLDTTARYLFLYQDRFQPSSEPVSQYTWGLGDARFSQVTSYGQWNLLLADREGVVSASNDFGPPSDDPFLPEGPAHLGVQEPRVATDPSAAQLVTLEMYLEASTPESDFGWLSTLQPGQMTNLYGYTTDAAPTMQLYLPIEAGYNGGEWLQLSVPEPSTSAALPLLWLMGWFRRRR